MAAHQHYRRPRVIAFDGKTLRGAKDAAGNLAHLLAGLCHRTGTVLAQCAVGAKTNEIPLLPKLLNLLDIAGTVITADAMHCQRETAEHIVGRGGHYILTVQGNQPSLRRQLKSLPWKQIPVISRTTENGHGRREVRSLKATEISDGVLFPHAVQVLQLTRTTRRGRDCKRRTEVVYAVTSLSVLDAHPGQVATWLRGHWAIENRRDQTPWSRSSTPHRSTHDQLKCDFAGPL
ncbi:ISAs1 family transposase, partial [Rhodococcus triatomae]